MLAAAEGGGTLRSFDLRGGRERRGFLEDEEATGEWKELPLFPLLLRGGRGAFRISH